MIKPVEIVTINKFIPIFKDGMEANAISVVNFNFENGDECGYNVIAQKGLYEIGDKAVYIQPDYCLSDSQIFDSFTKPGGDPKKSRLGKNNRIRAIKFNFTFQDKIDPIYSFGIMLPLSEVKEFLGDNFNEDNLQELLGITKYEEPETAGSGLTKGDFPSFMYKTDEENQANLKTKITQLCDGETELGYTFKHDGSSITVYFKKDNEGNWISGVCSRSQEKKLEQEYVTKYFSDKEEYGRYLHPETKVKGWFNHESKVFLTNEEIQNLVEEGKLEEKTVEVKDSWVELAKKSGLLENGLKYCMEHNVQLAFRGEIYGQGLKGSGNKVNPDANKKQGLILFGVDSLDNGFSKRLHYGNIHNLKTVCEAIGIEYTKPMVFKPTSYENFCEIAEKIIADEKANGRIIEGVVVRTINSNEISTKYMNSEYDSKK